MGTTSILTKKLLKKLVKEFDLSDDAVKLLKQEAESRSATVKDLEKYAEELADTKVKKEPTGPKLLGTPRPVYEMPEAPPQPPKGKIRSYEEMTPSTELVPVGPQYRGPYHPEVLKEVAPRRLPPAPVPTPVQLPPGVEGRIPGEPIRAYPPDEPAAKVGRPNMRAAPVPTPAQLPPAVEGRIPGEPIRIPLSDEPPARVGSPNMRVPSPPGEAPKSLQNLRRTAAGLGIGAAGAGGLSELASPTADAEQLRQEGIIAQEYATTGDESLLRGISPASVPRILQKAKEIERQKPVSMGLSELAVPSLYGKGAPLEPTEKLGPRELPPEPALKEVSTPPVTREQKSEPTAPSEPTPSTPDKLVEEIQKLAAYKKDKYTDALYNEAQSLNAQLAAAREAYQAEISLAKDEYEQEKTAARWGEMAEIIGRGLVTLAAAYKQAKTGRDVMGNIDPRAQVNWLGQIQNARQELGSALTLARNNYEMSAEEIGRKSKQEAEKIKGDFETGTGEGAKRVPGEMERLGNIRDLQRQMQIEKEEEALRKRQDAAAKKQLETLAAASAREKARASAEEQAALIKDWNTTVGDLNKQVQLTLTGKTKEQRAAAQLEVENILENKLGISPEVASKELPTGWFRRGPSYGETMSADQFKKYKEKINQVIASKAPKAPAPSAGGGIDQQLAGMPEEDKRIDADGVTRYHISLDDGSSRWMTKEELQAEIARRR